jgi:hypothetical protein
MSRLGVFTVRVDLFALTHFPRDVLNLYRLQKLDWFNRNSS